MFHAPSGPRTRLGPLVVAVLGVSLALGGFAACSDPAPGEPRGFAGSSDSEAGVPSDAGTVPHEDASPGSDSGTDAAAADPCAGRAVCDSFEGAAVGGKPSLPWKVVTNSGAVEVSTTRAYTGTHSLKLTTTTATYQRAMITAEGAPLFPIASNVLYGRMMAWLENAAGHNVHWNMIKGSGPVPGHSGVTGAYNYGGQLDKFLANYDTKNASTDCWKHSAKGMPIGKWVCFAWKMSGPTNELQLWTDGGELADMHVTNTGEGCIANDFAGVWIAPTFTAASVGWESVQNDPGHTMYIDDVVLDDQPLACP